MERMKSGVRRLETEKQYQINLKEYAFLQPALLLDTNYLILATC